MSFLYDVLQYHNPVVGARRVKLRVEEHMSSVLVVGGAILAAAYGFAHRTTALVAPSVALAGLGAVVGGGSLFYVHLAIRARRLLLNYCQLRPELRQLVCPVDEETTNAPASQRLPPPTA